MKTQKPTTIEEIEQFYAKIVHRFLPDLVELSPRIAFELETFFAENGYDDVTNVRLKKSGDVISETLYDTVKLEGLQRSVYQEDDIYLNVDGNEIYFGFDWI